MTFEEYIEIADKKFQDGLYEESIENYNKAIELNPNKADAYFNRGNAKVNICKYKEAIKDYDKVIDINPKCDASAYNNRGFCKATLGKHKESIEDFDKAIENNPDYASAYCNRGGAQATLGKHKESIKDFDKAIELNPEDASAYYNRGGTKIILGKHEDAIKDFGDAIKLKPNSFKNLECFRSANEDLNKDNVGASILFCISFFKDKLSDIPRINECIVILYGFNSYSDDKFFKERLIKIAISTLSLITSSNKKDNLVIYHYTNKDSLEHILPQPLPNENFGFGSPSLMLNHISAMNDEREGKFLLEDILELSNYQNSNENIDEILSDIFITSFTDDGGDRLSQWRAYSDDGEGVSLGIPYKLFNKKLDFSNLTQEILPNEIVNKNKQNKESGQSINALLCGPVIYYDENNTENDLDDIISDAKKLRDEAGDCENKKNDIVRSLKLLIPFIKNSDYKEEKEYRLVSFSNTNIDFIKSDKTGLSSPRIKISGDNNKFIYNTANIDYPIKIGPKCKYKDNVKLAIRERIKKYNPNVKVKIENSKINYR